MKAPLALVQSIAWAKMVVEYRQGNGLRASLQKTFDGVHPCSMCLNVRRAARATTTGLTAGVAGDRLDLAQRAVAIDSFAAVYDAWVPDVLLRRYQIILPSELPPPKEII